MTTAGNKAAVAAPQPLSLRRNFSWTFAGNVVYAGCQWGILVVLAKLGSPEMVGVFGLALAVTAPVIMFANLELRLVMATDAARRFRLSSYFTLRLLSMTVAVLFIAALALAGGFERETAFVIIAVGVAKAIEAISLLI